MDEVREKRKIGQKPDQVREVNKKGGLGDFDQP